MIRRIAFVGLITILNVSSGFAESVTSYFLYSGGSFNVLELPGSRNFSGGGLGGSLNNAGEFVGTFTDASGNHHFLYSAGSFQILPTGTPTAINDNGQIIGVDHFSAPPYTLNSSFLFSDGQKTTLNPPGSVTPGTGFNAVYGINNQGQIVGTFGTTTVGPPSANAVPNGFLYSGGSFTNLSVPGSAYTIPFGINDYGDVVGGAAGIGGIGGIQGFLYSGGIYTILGPSAATAINNAGAVVGSPQYCGGGFLYSGGSLTFLSVPGSTGTGARDINNAGEVVGSFCNGVTEHAYVYSGGEFTALDVPSSIIPGIDVQVLRTHGIAINDSGQVLGTVTYTTPESSSLILLGFGLAGVFAAKRRICNSDGPK